MAIRNKNLVVFFITRKNCYMKKLEQLRQESKEKIKRDVAVSVKEETYRFTIK